MLSRRWLAGLALCLSLLAACQGRKKKLIAVVPKGTAHLFWVSVQAGAMAAGQQSGVDITWQGPPAETDYDRQIQIVDSMLARHVDGLALAATERKALVQSLDRAAALGIPVTVFDSGVDSDKYMTFIATNNYEGGQIAARELARLVKGKGTVAMVENAPGSASTMDRERAFEDVIHKEYPQIEIVARQFGLSDRAKAMTAAENILTAHPDLNGMFASAEPSSLGAALALKARGMGGKVRLVAFDASEPMVEELKAGIIDATVAQDPFGMGFQAVKTLVDKLNGQTPPKHIDLSPHLIHREDLDKPEIHALLFPDIQKYIHQ